MIDQGTFPGIELENNPVLRHELKGTVLSQKRRDVRRHFVIVTAVIVLIVAALCCWAGVTGCQYFVDFMNSKTCELRHITAAAFRRSIFPFVAYGSLFIGLLLDFYFISLPGGRLRQEKESGSWDLIRTTPLSPIKIIAAKYTSAQFQAWPVLTIEIALRVAVIVGYTVDGISAQIGRTLPFTGFSFFVSLGLSVLIGIVYILEPIWRMRMVVSMGLAISIKEGNATSLALKYFGALLAMRVSQVSAASLYFLILGAWLNSMHLIQDEYTAILLPALGLFALCVYFFYLQGRGWMLRRAMRLASIV
jgi:hypothetical protein